MPFAGYKNFADCVSKNSSKKNPNAYCATIMRATEASDPSPEKRRQYAKKGIALSDGSYPIPDVAHLKAAIKAFGRAKDPEATKHHIIKRARALGRTDLIPEDWKGSTKNSKESEEGQELKLTGREIIEVTEAEFSTDDQGRMHADMVLIRAGRAKNPRNYRASALKKAAESGIYTGLRMFVNHSDKPPIKRGMSEMVSAVESTTWDPAIKPQGGIRAGVEIFDKNFYEYAERAKKYIGVSADHTIAVTKVREGQQLIEDVHEIVQARSVDWVLYPSAGGEILQFVREDEGDEEVDWDKITLEDLKANAPDLYKSIQATAKESEGPEDDDDEEEDDSLARLPKGKTLEQLVQEQVQSILDKNKGESEKKAATTKQVKAYVDKAGLPARTAARVIASFADATEYVEADVKESVEEAKTELKEAGARGPQITGMGTSTTEEGESQTPVRVGARESVEEFFLGPKKKDDEKKDEKK